MDKLRSEQEKLSMWLSSDPDYILEQCGDILSINEWKEVQKQTAALQKTNKLLNIIIHKGGDTCQSFLEILRENEGRYQDLHQFFHPTTQGSTPPTVFADNSSAVTAREIKNLTAKDLTTTIEIESKPGGNPPRKAALQVTYTANNGSLICADRITDVSIDGSVNYSVSIRPRQPNPVTARHSGPSPQISNHKDPAVKWITDHKVKLISCLKADLFILQYVHEKEIVTDSQYDNLKHSSPPETTVINLIDQVIIKGQETCEKFLVVLKEPDVLNTYPQLKNILNLDA
ncbi:uncharacterized protein si:dkey-10c21.1 [Melanotaenia boesemani]|uniref:uncharacterized protein si:dkey-10c21.1 n=1 Tax=Melanotaenia boesemani TaxID=1250792 RepID=UPI001C05B877|nr:uncharacterized protein si:dkey-10c21.1 [Melanotaenia boesemani]